MKLSPTERDKLKVMLYKLSMGKDKELRETAGNFLDVLNKQDADAAGIKLK